MNGEVRGRSASPRPLHGAQSGSENRRGPAVRSRSRSPSRSYRSRSRASARSYSRSASRSMSHSRSRSRSRSRPMSISRSPERSTPSDRDASKTALSVTSLSDNVKDTHLRQIFGWYGKVIDVHIPSEPRDGVRVSYIVFSSVQEAAKAALYMGNGQIDGATVEVKTCAPPLDVVHRRSDGLSNGRRRGDWDRRDSYRAADDDERYRASDLRSRFGPSRGVEPPLRQHHPQQHDRARRWGGQPPPSSRYRSPPPPPPRKRSRSPYRSERRRSYTETRASPSYS